MHKIFTFLKNSFWSFASIGMMGIAVLLVGAFLLSRNLPDVESLKEVQFQVPLRVFTKDGKLMSEFGEKRRTPVKLEEVPKPLIHAVLATEDQRFYDHPGVDFFGLARATIQYATSGVKAQGGSTITMQVARNFFLTRKKTFSRKLNEILLAIKIDRELSKDKILELYLNKIYFGQRAYGVAAAAYVYYGKPLNELTLPQMAMIAGLPKAPSAINPITNPEKALKRRNHVLERMLSEKYINERTYRDALYSPLTASYHGPKAKLHAPYVAELARGIMIDRYGDEAYTKGLQVYTTVDSSMQIAANDALRNGLFDYDKRYGYREPEDNLLISVEDADTSAWIADLQKISTIHHLIPAAVLNLQQQSITALLKTGEIVDIPWEGLSWARPQIDGSKKLGPSPKKADDIVDEGDVIRVLQNKDGSWRLAQVPEVEGAIVAMDPKDGEILALSGGLSYSKSMYNRAVQAYRQPGSVFKPFVFAAALAKDMTLASIINDAPVVIEDTGIDELWRPQNYTQKFYGPTRLRVGLAQSRNMVSIRLLEQIGIKYAIDYISRFGFDPDNQPKALSLSLGSGAVTPLELTNGFAIIANGGYQVVPYIIDTITDSMGDPIYHAVPKVACETCDELTSVETDTPEEQYAPQIISPRVAYLINSALMNVIKYGTGRKAKELGRDDLAGKTGTTNDQMDAWFAGYNSDVATTVWVGFDRPRTLHEYGAQSSLPIWIDFMREALKDKPEHTMPQPAGITTVRIDPKTGLKAHANDKKAIFEIFRTENIPEMADTYIVESEQAGDTSEAEEESFEHLF